MHASLRHAARQRRPAARGRMRGSVVVNAIIAVSLVLIVLIGTQVGYMFYVKRELQKTADLAALSGAQAVQPASCTDASAAAVANAAQNMPALLAPVSAAEVQCGHWDPAAHPAPLHFGTPSAGQYLNAVRVTLTRTAPLLLPALPGNPAFAISVEALAAKRQPLASLSIRSTLATVDTQRSVLLNALVGGMLGGSLSLSAGGWQGLVDSRIRLLDFLDQLKLDLGISTAGYDGVLGTDVNAGVLLQSMIKVMERGGATANVAVQALQQIALAAQASPVALKLGELLDVATGTDTAGLQTDLQLFDLVQGVVQLANGKNALAADIPVSLPGIAGVTAKVRAIEPPQVSAVGNPALIDPSQGVSDPNRIYVRTAQVRLLLSVNLSGLSNVVSNLLSAVTAAISPLINFLESVATLNLGTIVSDLVGTIACGGILPACAETKVIYASALSAPIDVSLSSGNGAALVTGHTCGVGENKTLAVQASTSVAQLHIGKVTNPFSSSAPALAEPVELIEIGYSVARFDSCLLSLICSGKKWKNAAGTFVTDPASAKKNVISGLGLSVNADVGGSAGGQALNYAAPAAANLPEIDAAPYDGPGLDPSFQPLSTQSLVQSLGPALGSVKVQAYASSTSGVLGPLLNGTLGLVSGLLNTLQNIVKDALAPLLDPAVNLLLDLLGIDLARAEVGARLSCHRGVELVY
ncbi:TadG family pilus assembly protein [Variovorax sp. TBS-050B]|uniref:TadG family pilus assembly protein n=1 Tax=Variovorax sp. TBS-050B TaxID=2940551 RepID=UPI0024750A22|nr:TadG family pilus assembly protein [Variovorax sp. TBS-050B]